MKYDELPMSSSCIISQTVVETAAPVKEELFVVHHHIISNVADETTTFATEALNLFY